MAKKDSSYTVLNIRFARVTREAARNYINAQEKILGRNLSFTQLVNDCLIERLERDGFLPKIVADETPTSDDLIHEQESDALEELDNAPPTERSWETT